jgi:hypothetical protein
MPPRTKERAFGSRSLVHPLGHVDSAVVRIPAPSVPSSGPGMGGGGSVLGGGVSILDGGLT